MLCNIDIWCKEFRAPCPRKDVWWMIETGKKNFSVLTLKIICIKPFTCNNAIFLVLFLNGILFLHHPLNIFLKHNITDCILNLIEHWLIDSASICEWYSFTNASISHNSAYGDFTCSVSSHFNFCYLSFQQEI